MLTTASIERREQRSREAQHHIDLIVMTALIKLGGVFDGRVMALRHHLHESLREAQIKESLKRLEAAGKIKSFAAKVSSDGKRYEVIGAIK